MTLAEFLVIILFAAICFHIAFKTIQIGCPPNPSSFQILKSIDLEKINSSPRTIIDLGSGFGFSSLYLSLKYKNTHVIGYELSFFPWLISKCLKALFLRKNLLFFQKDFFKVDLSSADILYCYLTPQIMSKLLNESPDQISPHTWIISNFFRFREDANTLDHIYLGPNIYAYRLRISDGK